MQMYLVNITPNVLKYIYWTSKDIWKLKKKSEVVYDNRKAAG